MVSTSYKRLFLRGVKMDAERRSKPLLTVLNELTTAQVKKTAGGIFISAAEGNGQKYNLLPNAGEGLTPLSFAEMLSDLLDRYEAASYALINDDAIPAPTDQQIFAEMLSKLNPATFVTNDYSGGSRAGFGPNGTCW